MKKLALLNERNETRFEIITFDDDTSGYFNQLQSSFVNFTVECEMLCAFLIKMKFILLVHSKIMLAFTKISRSINYKAELIENLCLIKP